MSDWRNPHASLGPPPPPEAYRPSAIPAWVTVAAVAVATAVLATGTWFVVSHVRPRAHITVDAAPIDRTPAPHRATRTPDTPQLDANGDPVFTPLPAVSGTGGGTAGLPPVLLAPPEPGPVVTPKTAEQIVRAAWDVHNLAVTHVDTTLMANLDTGLALEVDLGRCSCGDRLPLGRALGVAVSVPRQTTYPAQFLAEVATTHDVDPFVAFVVFSRSDPGSPWKLAFLGGMVVDNASVTPPATDADGYLRTEPAAPKVDPAAVHAQLADYWRTAKRTQAVPPPGVFRPGVWTTDFAKTLSEHGQGQIGSNGLIGWYAYQADPAPDHRFVFAEGQGWRIVCSAVRVQKTFTGSGPGDGPFQDPNRQNWGASVPPGVHTAITTTQVSVPCIEIPPAGSAEGVRVLGADEHGDVDWYR